MGIRLPTEDIQFPNLALDIQYSKMDFWSHGNRLKTAFEVDPSQYLATAISLLVNNEFPAKKNGSRWKTAQTSEKKTHIGKRLKQVVHGLSNHISFNAPVSIADHHH